MQAEFVTEEELMKTLSVADHKTIRRMIADGELPPHSYGNSPTAKKKGWHRAVLESHSLRRYENIRSTG